LVAADHASICIARGIARDSDRATVLLRCLRHALSDEFDARCGKEYRWREMQVFAVGESWIAVHRGDVLWLSRRRLGDAHNLREY
jgi:hypothetical protein